MLSERFGKLPDKLAVYDAAFDSVEEETSTSQDFGEGSFRRRLFFEFPYVLNHRIKDVRDYQSADFPYIL
jgi:hypothetical protein